MATGTIHSGYTTAPATTTSYIFSMSVAKYGEVKVAVFEIRTASALIPAAYTKIATLPDGYCPHVETSQVIIDGDGKRAIVRFQTDGDVYCYNYSGTHISAAWSVAYI